MKAPGQIDLLGRLDAVLFGAVPETLQLTFVAGGGLERLGLTVEECVDDAQFLIKRLHPDEREAVLAMLRAVAADGKQRQIEHRLVGKEGQERWFRTEAHAVAAGGEPRLLGLMIDVDDARRTAEALRATEARLQQIVDAAPIVIFALDDKGVILLSQGSGLKSLGLRSGQIVGLNVWDLYKDESAEIRDNIRRALAGEAFTSVGHMKSGIVFETHWAPSRDANGRLLGTGGVAVNITERQKAEEASAQSMSLLRATLEATTDGILVVDNGGRIVDFNHRFAEMWHHPDEVLAPRDDGRALAHAVRQLRDPDAFLTKVRQLYADPEAVSHDIIEFLDGRIFERDSRPQRVGGTSVGRVWSFRDVTVERRATRRATLLAAASKLLAAPLEDVTPFDDIARLAVPFLGDWCNILLLDGDGTLRNVAACHVEPDKSELLRKLTPDLRLGDRGVARVLATGEPVVLNDLPLDSEAQFSLSDPDQLAVVRALKKRAMLAVPMHVHGQIVGAMTFASADPRRRYDDEDVTLATELAQRAALAIENQRLYRASKEAVALRDEFLSVASHELRTPVTSLQLAVQSALSVGANDEQAPPGFLKHALESAERQTRRLGRLVDALLDVSRIQAGKLELTREPMDLAALVREVTALIGEEARRAGCEVALTAPDEPLVGRWDRARLEQVVINLLSNAIKYGAGSPIALSLARRDGCAVLEVRDHGIGVPPAERARIFERFERAVSSKHYGGLGLGLYIVRRIVDAHGGHIVVESAPGQGARFIVELPLQ